MSLPPPTIPEAGSHQRPRLYAATVGLFPFLLLVLAATWIHSGSLIHLPFVQNVGYGARLQNADCQVVLTGDSTALVGLDPRIISARTGLSACNIADVGSVQMVNGTLIPDIYLQHNRRPRFMVFSYAPEDLSHSPRWQFITSFEGTLSAFAFRPIHEAVGVMAHHPEQTLSDLELALRLGVLAQLKPHPHPWPRPYRDGLGGQFPPSGAPMHGCWPSGPERAPDPVWITHLRQKYSVGGTHVLIDVTPAPDCDPTLPFYRRTIRRGLLDNELTTFPASDFTTSGRDHVTVAGSVLLSNAVADQILAAEHAGSAAMAPGGAP